MKQHSNPCGTCPFTKTFGPCLAPGGSPLKVYVAQHFLPYRVPCHECVDYDNDNGDPAHGWKDGANQASQCVGFAQCRDGGGVGEFMPATILKSNLTDRSFRNIWEFWSYHNEITYGQALSDLTPSVIETFCREELSRDGMKVSDEVAFNRNAMAVRARRLAEIAYIQA